MKPFIRPLLATLVAVSLSATLSPALLADVNVVNESGETLFVAAGQVVGGRIIYTGWTRVDHARQANVYAGSDRRIMLSVVSIRNGAPYPWQIANHIGSADLMVSTDDFRCEQLGGLLPQWRMVNLNQNSIWVYDQFNPWPNDMNLFTTTFYVVPGNLDQRFIP